MQQAKIESSSNLIFNIVILGLNTVYPVGPYVFHMHTISIIGSFTDTCLSIHVQCTALIIYHPCIIYPSHKPTSNHRPNFDHKFAYLETTEVKVD